MTDPFRSDPTASPSLRPSPGRPVLSSGAPEVRLRRHESPVLGAIDGGGAVLQRRGRDVLVGSSLLLVPLVALNLWATTAVFERDGTTTLAAFGGDGIGSGIEDVAAVLVVLFGGLAAAVVGCFAAAIVVGERFARPVDMADALRTTVRRLPAVSVAWAAGHAWVPFVATWALTGDSSSTVGRLALVVPIAALGATCTLFVVPAMVAEQLSPWRALRRSWRLARLRFAAVLGFVVSSTCIGGLLLAGITLLPTLLQETGLVVFGDAEWLVQGVAGQLAVLVVVPLVALATSQMYLEVRLHAEGLDLVLDADAAFGTPR